MGDCRTVTDAPRPGPEPRRRLGLHREALLAGLAGVLLACLMRLPVLRQLRTGVPEDLGDPLLQAWQLAWGQHALRTQPLSPFDANTFWPLDDSLAFSDSLLGYAPLGLLFGDGAGTVVLRYNVVFLLTYALAFAGTYALVRQLGASRTAGTVSGIAFAYAPWHLAQEGHLQILSTGGIPLALALLARGHGYGRPGPARPGLVLAGWAVAAWQVTIGFGLGLQFGYLLGALTAVYAGAWIARRRGPVPRRLAVCEAVGMLGFLAVAGLFALPYLGVADRHPEAQRTVADLELFSPPASAFVTAPEDSLLYGDRQEGLRAGLSFAPEMTLAVGGGLVVLAAVGLVAGRWPLRRRLGLATGVLVLLVLAMGTQAAFGGRFSYLLLFDHAPGWQGIRTPGRLVVPMTLGLALLAAPGLDRVREALGGGRAATAVGALAVAVVSLETLGTTAVLPAPRVPPALERPQGPVLVLPSAEIADLRAMFFSSGGLYPLVNGYSGFTPTELVDLRGAVAAFPDPASIELLRRTGVRTVVLLPDEAEGTPWAGAEAIPVDGLPVTRRLVDGAVVFELSPP
ncbi:MAG: hypothetical protein JWN88_660 [Frankiales bacterium]|nr:hypothetical protein [Frankiales bacterium]